MNIVIIDTGCTNMSSVSSALCSLGYNPKISHDINILSKADKLILPGIGTTKSVMQHLDQWGVTNFIKNCTKPILGICLGMQLFGMYSQENYKIKTLGIINIIIERIKDCNLPLPHIGWNKVQIYKDSTLFNNITNNNYFYFIHGYAMKKCFATIAQTYYGEHFTAAIEHNNFFGVQFHPEKSGMLGYQVIKNFMKM